MPYLRSEYGKEYDFDAPVKLLDAMMHEQAQEPYQRVVVLGQVLAADINIGYEDIVNTRVKSRSLALTVQMHSPPKGRHAWSCNCLTRVESLGRLAFCA